MGQKYPCIQYIIPWINSKTKSTKISIQEWNHSIILNQKELNIVEQTCINTKSLALPSSVRSEMEGTFWMLLRDGTRWSSLLSCLDNRGRCSSKLYCLVITMWSSQLLCLYCKNIHQMLFYLIIHLAQKRKSVLRLLIFLRISDYVLLIFLRISDFFWNQNSINGTRITRVEFFVLVPQSETKPLQ